MQRSKIEIIIELDGKDIVGSDLTYFAERPSEVEIAVIIVRGPALRPHEIEGGTREIFPPQDRIAAEFFARDIAPLDELRG